MDCSNCWNMEGTCCIIEELANRYLYTGSLFHAPWDLIASKFTSLLKANEAPERLSAWYVRDAVGNDNIETINCNLLLRWNSHRTPYDVLMTGSFEAYTCEAKRRRNVWTGHKWEFDIQGSMTMWVCWDFCMFLAHFKKTCTPWFVKVISCLVSCLVGSNRCWEDGTRLDILRNP